MTWKPKQLHNLMIAGKLPNPYEIKPKNRFDFIDLGYAFGGVQKCDIGKQIKIVNGLIYMENTEQMKVRTGK